MIKGNLLIVDDEKLILESLSITLRPMADRIFTALNGNEAMQILRKETVHAIISDIRMPEMNGVELLKAIRAEKNDVPFVFFTGHGNVNLLEEAIQYGAFDFIDKPNMERLDEVVKTALVFGISESRSLILGNENQINEFQDLLINMIKKQ